MYDLLYRFGITEVLDNFIEQHKKDRTLLEKVRDAIRSLIAKLTGAEKRKAQTTEAKLTAALEAATKQAKRLHGKADGATMGAEKHSLKGNYWRPNLTKTEWALLDRHMAQEIGAGRIPGRTRSGQYCPLQGIHIQFHGH